MNVPVATSVPNRRRRLVMTAGCAAMLPTLALPESHDAAGEVQPPRPAPSIVVTDQDGRSHNLPSLLVGKVSAIQLMFTGCSSICPMQGALFAAVQESLQDGTLRDAQLLSLSIDPLADSAAELEKWRRKFSAGMRWRAAVCADRDLARLLGWLKGAPAGSLDRHATQTFFVERSARLIWSSTDLPAAREVVSVLRALQTKDASLGSRGRALGLDPKAIQVSG